MQYKADLGNTLISFVWSPPGGWKAEHKPLMELEKSTHFSSSLQVQNPQIISIDCVSSVSVFLMNCKLHEDKNCGSACSLLFPQGTGPYLQ